MTLSDDYVLGVVEAPPNARKQEPRIIRFRDLDKHIQDRLRAAEEMAEAAGEIGPDEIYDGECRCGVATYESPDQHEPDCDWRRLVEAIATYRATFQEADT